MSIQDKLNVKIMPGRISLQPNRRLASSLKWYAIIAVVTGLFLAIFYSRLGEGPVVLCSALIIYLVIQGLIDYIFRYNVRYEFDKATNAVYKENPPFGKKQLMRLDEVVIFTKSESGDWYYAMGVKKKQFLKNYKISPGFDNGKASAVRVAEFEEGILNPIVALLPAAAH
ncbi:hypothetical protein HHL17_20325 [Chitinophaga sp. G-6-1-13]|uniref:Uncharacterized protein n=1 Tax=Chitinophaga fulva TaxID=2728842 RepID=A0A848GQD0_9BACT|nr:hypothetical protein [Chitinophaga fulva]NML39559.1 hypothetical protein [Chitinophaga fulva]